MEQRWGESIRICRINRGISQKEAAEFLGVSRQAVSKWERGITVPSTENLMALGELYQVPLENLMGVKRNAQPDQKESPQLLVTKLQPPAGSLNVISRPRLLSLLKEGGTCKLITVVAPAGYGKTTVLREWASLEGEKNKRVTWLVLDNMNDCRQFWCYLCAALAKVLPEYKGKWEDAGYEEGLEQMDSLINDISALPVCISVILEDYHEIHTPRIHQSLQYLIEHMPSQLQFVLVSRHPVPLQLGRLRMQGQLMELQEKELAFDYWETVDFLNMMHMTCQEKEIASLLALTEGWIAGLQMAGLLLKKGWDLEHLHCADYGATVKCFDYLTEEVVNRQSPEIRQFLLVTSVLTDMTASLCDALPGCAGSREKLQYLEQENLLVFSVDEYRQWYRYHPLFKRYLESVLHYQKPEKIGEIHRAAYTWLMNNGYMQKAVPHALACGEFELAAEGIELLTVESSFLHTDLTMLLKWLEALPEKITAQRPKLALLLVHARITLAQQDKFEKTVMDFEQIFSSVSDDIFQESAGEDVQKEYMTLKTVVAYICRDYPQAEHLSMLTLARLGEEDYRRRGMILHYAHFAYLERGQLKRAAACERESVDICLSHGMNREYISSSCALARIYKYLGHSKMALEQFHQALELAVREHMEQRMQGFIRTEIGGVYLELGEMEKARDYIFSYDNRPPEGPVSAQEWNYAPNHYVILAYYYVLSRDFVQAGAYIDRARRNRYTRYAYNCPFLKEQLFSLELKLSLLKDRHPHAIEEIIKTGEAGNFADSGNDPEKVFIAGAWLELYGAGKTLALLSGVSCDEQTLPLLVWRIQWHILYGAALWEQGMQRESRAEIWTAVKLSASSGYVQIFADCGLRPGGLIKQICAQDEGVDHLHVFLNKTASYCEEFWAGEPIQETVFNSLEKPLSRREEEILRLLMQGKNMREISEKLYVSLNTMRTHIRNIYHKLGVHSRGEALEAAARLLTK